MSDRELAHEGDASVERDSTIDRPWSQYFCCMMIANREFVKKNPIATKRTIRAIVTATAICAREPERVARLLVERIAELRFVNELKKELKA